MWPLISKSSFTPHPGYSFGVGGGGGGTVVVLESDDLENIVLESPVLGNPVLENFVLPIVLESVLNTVQSLFGESRLNKIRNICKSFCRPMFTFQLDYSDGSDDTLCLYFSC